MGCPCLVCWLLCDAFPPIALPSLLLDPTPSPHPTCLLPFPSPYSFSPHPTPFPLNPTPFPNPPSTTSNCTRVCNAYVATPECSSFGGGVDGGEDDSADADDSSNNNADLEADGFVKPSASKFNRDHRGGSMRRFSQLASFCFLFLKKRFII